MHISYISALNGTQNARFRALTATDSLQVTGGKVPVTGAGIDFLYITGVVYVSAYDRAAATWKDIAIGGDHTTLVGQTYVSLNAPFINLNSTGYIQWSTPKVNPGGGAGATLNTIGGSGPTTALMEAWVPIKDSGGNIRWFPIWK